MDYLQAQDWRPARQLSRGRLLGLCPLHDDRQPQLSGGPQQEPVLLLRLWPWWRRDSPYRTISPGEVPASIGFTPAVARLAAVTAPSCRFLSPAVTPPQRGRRFAAQEWRIDASGRFASLVGGHAEVVRRLRRSPNSAALPESGGGPACRRRPERCPTEMKMELPEKYPVTRPGYTTFGMSE